MTALNGFERTVEIARTRNVLIPALIESGRNYQPVNPRAKSFVDRLVWAYVIDFVPGTLDTLANLAKAAEVSQKQQLIITPNHLTDGDHPVIETAFDRFGFPELTTPRTVYPAGLKMIERGHIRFLSGAVTKVLIPTDTDIEAINQALKASGLTEQQREVLESCSEHYTKLKRRALVKIGQLQRSGGITVVYPEGTRSRNGFLRQAPDRIEAYFKTGVVLPVAHEGVEQMLPPEKYPRVWRRFVARVAAGEPYDVSQLWTVEISEIIAGLGLSRIDVVMAQIAKLNWDRVDPKLQSRYRLAAERVPLEYLV